jgi:hypothetical protein
LQAKLGLAEKVNLVVQKEMYSSAAGESAGSMFNAAELEFRDLPNNLGVEVRTPRVFLEPSIVEAIRKNEATPS